MTRIVLVGGGILGLALAWRLSRRDGVHVTLVEKEPQLASHQTGRNSGVIHSGIYYPPNSMKARTCLRGRELMEEFCEREGLPWERCGKLIVATRPEELPGLQRLYERGLKHGLAVRSLDDWRQLEPHCAGLQAVYVPETGIVDYRQVSERLAMRAQEAGAEIVLGERILGSDGRTVRGETREFPCDLWVNCAGLYSDRFTPGPVRIVPFRGEYYTLTEEARFLCRGLIYPVPDPRFPFLGVHLTRHIDGSVGAGPNAVLSLGRENYTGWQPNWREAWETLCFPGFQKLALRYWRMGLEEQLRSLSRGLFLRALQRLTPELRGHHLVRSRSGIRAQAVHRDGQLIDDFVVKRRRRGIHVINAPSPAATASLAIAEHVEQLMSL